MSTQADKTDGLAKERGAASKQVEKLRAKLKAADQALCAAEEEAERRSQVAEAARKRMGAALVAAGIAGTDRDDREYQRARAAMDHAQDVVKAGQAERSAIEGALLDAQETLARLNARIMESARQELSAEIDQLLTRHLEKQAELRDFRAALILGLSKRMFTASPRINQFLDDCMLPGSSLTGLNYDLRTHEVHLGGARQLVEGWEQECRLRAAGGDAADTTTSQAA